MAGELTFDASSAGVAQAVTIKSDALSKVQVAEVFVTPTGTYAQGATESIEVQNVADAIQNSRRNGKTVTMIAAMGGQSSNTSAGVHYHFKTAVVNSADVDCTIFEVGGSELGAVAIPAMAGPLSFYVLFTEA
jgi:hypothetical protein